MGRMKIPMRRSNEPCDLISQAIREAADAWRVIGDENILAAYRASQHLEGKHDGDKANDMCLYCQEDYRDE